MERGAGITGRIWTTAVLALANAALTALVRPGGREAGEGLITFGVDTGGPLFVAGNYLSIAFTSACLTALRGLALRRSRRRSPASRGCASGC